jgi:pimeloyl-ACP methyl ester carboxylesterase
VPDVGDTMGSRPVAAGASRTGSLQVDACTLHYRVDGDAGPRLVLIQGVGLHGDGWGPQLAGLAHDHQVLTFDNRGMGRSQPLGGPLTGERMAADAVALLDHLGWAHAHVTGHSLGGLVAIHLGLAARTRVRSLALLCTVARGAVATRPSWPIVKVGAVSGLPSGRIRRRAFLALVLSARARRAGDPDRLAEELAPLFGHDLAVQPPVVGHQLRALRAYDARTRLAELAGVPTVVVNATEDPIAPPGFGRALAAGIPGARFVELADAAHGVTIERADDVNTLLREHVAAAEGVHDAASAAAADGSSGGGA